MLLEMAPRMIKPIDRAADFGVFSDTRTTDGGMAAIALFTRPEGDLMVLLRGAAD